MRTIATLIFIAAVSLTPAIAADFLDIPANTNWTKVQDGDAIQWSIITSARPKTRIDLINHLEKDGTRNTYYLVRSACSNGELAVYTIKPGYKMGLGMDCNGSLVPTTSTATDEVQRLLPPEAAALLKP